jgi:lysophospholipase L1-like esterase
MQMRWTSVVKTAVINAVVLLALLVPVELVFGTWVRAIGPSDLRRFSIPIGARFEFDAGKLYGNGQPKIVHYSRDEFGLRGGHPSLAAIDVLTVGGSTTEQRYLDDAATWQSVAESRLQALGAPLVIANAGVDGQSTVGHLFNFDFWFPALPELKPKVVLFYLGINDTLRHDRRHEYDSNVDMTSWKRRSATYQLLRTMSANLRARAVGVYHGRRRELSDDSYTAGGLVPDPARREMAAALNDSFGNNVRSLVERVRKMNATPVFMTQASMAWEANPERPPRGLTDTITILGSTVNYVDVSYLHQSLNQSLLDYCRETGITCLDLASDVSFGPDDYYDYIHNTPAGAAKIGEYVAAQLRRMPIRKVQAH